MQYIKVNSINRRPATCAVCKDNQGPAIDTRRDIVKFGRLYVCERCVREMAVALGLPHPDDHERVCAEHEALTQRTAEQEETIASLQTQLEAAASDVFAQLTARVLAPAPRGRRGTRKARKPAEQPEQGSNA
jgi:hypothetical protein